MMACNSIINPPERTVSRKLVLSGFMKNISLLILSFTAILILTETGIRIIKPLSLQKYFIQTNDVSEWRGPSELLHHQLRPESSGIDYSKTGFIFQFIMKAFSNYRSVFTPPSTTYIVNDLGFRDNSTTFNSLKWKRAKNRVIIAGDSFTEGQYVAENDTFARILERSLKNNGHDVSVLNAGCNSYSPVLEYLLIKERLLALEPTHIILLFDISDLRDDSLYSLLSKKDEDGIVTAVSPHGRQFLASRPTAVNHIDTLNITPTVLKKIFAKSIIYNLLSDNIRNFLTHVKTYEDRNTDVMPEELLDAVYHTRENMDIDIYRRQSNLTFQYLRRIKTVLKENDIKFAIVLYPWPHMVGPDVSYLMRKQWRFDEHIYHTPLNRDFSEFCRKFQIRCLDMTEGFREYHNPGVLYYSDDIHWTRAGHRFVADLLTLFIKSDLNTNDRKI